MQCSSSSTLLLTRSQWPVRQELNAKTPIIGSWRLALGTLPIQPSWLRASQGQLVLLHTTQPLTIVSIDGNCAGAAKSAWRLALAKIGRQLSWWRGGACCGHPESRDQLLPDSVRGFPGATSSSCLHSATRLLFTTPLWRSDQPGTSSEHPLTLFRERLEAGRPVRKRWSVWLNTTAIRSFSSPKLVQL
jgi:hypothetical protein